MTTKSHLTLAVAGLTALLLAASGCTPQEAPPAETSAGTSDEKMQSLAEEAYIYAFPILMSYKTMYQYSVEPGTSQYKAPFNQLKNTARVYGPQDTTVISANSDTPYSLLWTDLRAEPVVLTFPKIERSATSSPRPRTSAPISFPTSAAGRRATRAAPT